MKRIIAAKIPTAAHRFFLTRTVPLVFLDSKSLMSVLRPPLL